MIKNALHQGIMADYVLMDTWFTHEPLIRSILREGLDVMISHTTIIYTRYILLVWLRRNEKDQKPLVNYSLCFVMHK